MGVTGFVGVKLGNSDYGWIRLLISGIQGEFTGTVPNQIKVIDWAYESCTGQSINAGQTRDGATCGSTDVPEPSTLALLAMGALGISAFRRRKALAASR